MKITTPPAGQAIWAEQAGKAGRSAADQGQSLPARLLFSPGQLIRGQVVGVNPDGKLLLAIDGQTVEARSEVMLKPGSSFWFEVKQNEPLWLRMAERKGAAQDFLQQYGADSSAMGRGLRALLEMATLSRSGSPGETDFLLGFAEAAQDGQADSGRLLRLLSILGQRGASPMEGKPGSAGVLHEKVMELASLLAREENPVARTTAASFQKLGSLLALQSELNALPSTPQNAMFQLFPCLFAMDAGWGQWLFSRDQQNDEAAADRGEYALSFFLEMSRLGEVQIQLKGQGEALRGEFVVAGEEVRDHLAPQLEELAELLGGLGYRPVQLSCRVGRTGLLESMKGALEQVARLEPVRIVDLQA